MKKIYKKINLKKSLKETKKKKSLSATMSLIPEEKKLKLKVKKK
jgi:hypothetical protein